MSAQMIHASMSAGTVADALYAVIRQLVRFGGTGAEPVMVTSPGAAIDHGTHGGFVRGERLGRCVIFRVHRAVT